MAPAKTLVQTPMTTSEVALFDALHNGSSATTEAAVMSSPPHAAPTTLMGAMAAARSASPPPAPRHSPPSPLKPRSPPNRHSPPSPATPTVPLVDDPAPPLPRTPPPTLRTPPSRRSGAGAAIHSPVPIDINAEKQNALLEIERLRHAGAVTTRDWSMSQELEDMRLEARRLQANIDETQMVAMMREFMVLGFNGIEYASSFVSMVHLDGWASTMTSDMQRYDPALSKLYRRYWRRATATPEAELMMTIAMSMVSHHFRAKFAQKRAARPASAAPAPAPVDVTIESDSDGEEMPPPRGD